MLFKMGQPTMCLLYKPVIAVKYMNLFFFGMRAISMPRPIRDWSLPDSSAGMDTLYGPYYSENMSAVHNCLQIL